MSKYTCAERHLVKSLVANLSIKRIPDNEIMLEVFRQTGKSLSRSGLYATRQQIKKESYYWYEKLRKDNLEYIYQFKERINEITDLQRQHHQIIADNADNPTIQQTSLAELHKLNITLSNYFDVAPTILTNQTARKENDNTVSIPQQDKENIII